MRILAAGLLALCAAPPAGAADSMRCGARVLSVGASIAEVLSACGEPSFRDTWASPYRAGYVSDVEEWYYNFGPQELLHILKLQQGRLADIGDDGYGWSAPDDGHCQPHELVPGLSKLRLLQRCGEPVTREAVSLLKPLRTHDGRVHPRELVPTYREEWVYNFGSDRMLERVVLENGRVTDVESERGSGFDPP